MLRQRICRANGNRRTSGSTQEKRQSCVSIPNRRMMIPKLSSPRETRMETKRILPVAVGVLVAVLVQTEFARLLAQAEAPSALSGQVTSAEEGPMEGVVVSAKSDGSTISISVVSNAAGRFAFPAARLEPGHYELKARAAGYELDGTKEANVATGQEAKADIKLK